MKRQLYLECCSGISGDMAAAALLDLGADPGRLMGTLKTLGIGGYEVKISRVKKSGIDACDFAVLTGDEDAGLDHDMEYLYGHVLGHARDAGGPGHPHGEHGHRGLAEIKEILTGSGMTPNAKEIAVRIFTILAEAEAEAHGIPVNEVHFHEVGAVDSIVDIAAASICLDDLGIDEVIVPVLFEGCGTVRCRHGILPIPVPATLNIVRKYGLNLHGIGITGELVTPTGAAIAAAVRTGDRLPERYRVDGIGIGAGKREYESSGILRAMLITPA